MMHQKGKITIALMMTVGLLSTITLDQGQLFMNNLLGSTTLYADPETSEIYWATIELRHPYTERVLEHEIGHALGWLHTRTRGHMMHPLHFEGGWDDDAL